MEISDNAKILVTGGCGFIGTNLIHHLLSIPGLQVLNVDKRPAKTTEVQNVTTTCDICDKDELFAIVQKFNPDYIIHLAARTDLDGATLQDYDANITGVENVLTAAASLGSLKKILITSSMLVCGPGYAPKDQFDYAPTTVYGQSKVQTENIVWANKPTCDWAILRPTSIWGPWFEAPYKNFFDMVMAHKYFHIGRKSCTKTYGYIGNTVYQIMQILSSPTPDEQNKVFYLGDAPTNIEQWADEIANELGYKVHRCPYALLKLAAWGGDVLKLLGVHFPMTSFRLRNMTTNNVVDLTSTNKLAPNPPFSRIEGVKITLNWMKNRTH